MFPLTLVQVPFEYRGTRSRTINRTINRIINRTAAIAPVEDPIDRSIDPLWNVRRFPSVFASLSTIFHFRASSFSSDTSYRGVLLRPALQFLVGGADARRASFGDLEIYTAPPGGDSHRFQRNTKSASFRP